MAVTTWTIKTYNLAGNLTGTLDECTERQITFPLNGVDQLNFTMWLDDPDAPLVQPLTTVVKMWRNVDDPIYNKSFTQPSGTPTFAGIVGYVNKDGASNKMQVQVYSPMWRLKFRFHLLNHRLVKNNLTGDVNYGINWDQSELMWKLIDLTNGAFGGSSHTQIYKGTWYRPTITISPYFVAQGSNVWSNVVDDILARPSGVDIVPRYIHTADTPNLMFFDTEKPRGTDRATGRDTTWSYHTGLKNLSNITELTQVEPNVFGNYDWVIGQGNANSNKIGIAYDATGKPYSYGTVGVYMMMQHAEEANDTVAALSIADQLIMLSRNPAKGYTVQLSPMTPPYFATDFKLGDLVLLNADRGAMYILNQEVRIVQITLGMSDNNVESSEVLLMNDLRGRFA